MTARVGVRGMWMTARVDVRGMWMTARVGIRGKRMAACIDVRGIWDGESLVCPNILFVLISIAEILYLPS